MLNKNGERELAYVVLVDGIEELPGYDRVESACIGGWRCIVPKGQFHVGDPGIYFEIDSRVPSDNPAFAFLEKRKYKVKTLKMCRSRFTFRGSEPKRLIRSQVTTLCTQGKRRRSEIRSPMRICCREQNIRLEARSW